MESRQEPGGGADTQQGGGVEGGHGGAGEDAAKVSPKIADDAKKGQTQVPAPEDEVGVPRDEEMNRDR
jgi:hypothetical protein